MRLVSTVTSTRSPTATRSRMRASRSSTCPWAGRSSTLGSSRPVGRTSCSTTSPPDSSTSKAAGVAETKSTWFRRPMNSSKVRGRLSRADGSRKPYSTSVPLRERSPKNMPRTWGTETWDSSTTSSQSLGK